MFVQDLVTKVKYLLKPKRTPLEQRFFSPTREFPFSSFYNSYSDSREDNYTFYLDYDNPKQGYINVEFYKACFPKVTLTKSWNTVHLDVKTKEELVKVVKLYSKRKS